MTAFIGLLLLIAVAVAGFVSRGWLSARLLQLKDHSKKQEELHVDGVEIVVQKPVNERRLKLALPDLSSIQLNSPVGPMKSSIRSALKELRSRQMVQNLCSRFESRLKVSSNERETNTTNTKKTEDVPTLTVTRARRRDAREAAVPPVVLSSDLTKESEISANARSNNLNKFLRSYASNLDNAISAERRVVIETDAIPTERCVVMATDAEDNVAQPDKSSTAEEVTTPSESCPDSDGSGMELDLDLQTLRLETEYSNQCQPAGSNEEVAEMVEATDCEPLADEKSDESDEGNNNNGKTTAEKLSIAFTLSDCILNKQFVPEFSHPSDNEPETCSFPPAKQALAQFKQQVPSNRRARNIATLRL